MIGIKDKNYYPALTGIRAIAAYLVYLHHTNPFSINICGNFIHQFVHQFDVGVSIFFVLSGLLITLRYYQPDRTQSWLKYFKNRMARIFPMYFIISSLTLLVLIAQNKQTKDYLFEYFMNISLLKGFFDDLKFTLVGQGWSLTTEECFYILAPLLFLALRKNKWLIVVFCSGFLLIGCLLVFIFSEKEFFGFFNSYNFLFTYTFPGRCFEFFCGVAIITLFKVQLYKIKKGFFLTVISLIIVTILLAINASLPNIYHFSFTKIIINNFLLPIGIALFLLGLMTEESLLKKLLSSDIFVILGKSSYTFYLIHIGIFYSFLSVHLTTNFILLFILLNLLALILWYFVEEPLHQWLKK